MSNVVTSTTGWGSRLGGAFKGIVTGLILVGVAFVLLFWNEKRTVETYRGLKEMESVTVDADSTKLEASNDGKCVHMTGAAKTDEILTDPFFGVEVNGFHLSRTVEMYQWVEDVQTETKKNVGGSETTTKTYSYKMDWSSSLNDSSAFNDKSKVNPSVMPYESVKFDAKTATFGAFRLSEAQIGMVSKDEPFAVKAPEVAEAPVAPVVPAAVETPVVPAAPAAVETPVAPVETPVVPAAVETPVAPVETPVAPAAPAAVETPVVPAAPVAVESQATADTVATPAAVETPATVETPAATTAPATATAPATVVTSETQTTVPVTPEGDGRKYVNDGIYYGENPAKPAIGDVRISFRYVPSPQDISIAAVQTGDTFTNYVAKNGKTFNLLNSGTVSSAEMFAGVQSANKMMGWLLRLVGFVLMYIGFSMIFAPLSVLADVLPILGNIVEVGTKMVAFLLALVLSLLTIGIAWLVYRPLIGIPLVVISLGILIYTKVILKKKAA